MPREIIDRRSWEAMLAHLDGDDQNALRAELEEQYEGGDCCQEIEVQLDSLGRLDSQSSPRPAWRGAAAAWADQPTLAGEIEYDRELEN